MTLEELNRLEEYASKLKENWDASIGSVRFKQLIALAKRALRYEELLRLLESERGDFITPSERRQLIREVLRGEEGERCAHEWMREPYDMRRCAKCGFLRRKDE